MAKAQRLIAVLMALGMLVSGLGFAEDGQGAILSESGTISSMAYYGSTLSILTYETLYQWDEATGEMTAHPIDLSSFEEEDSRVQLGEAVACADGVYALTYFYTAESSAEELAEVRLCPVLVEESGAATLGEGIELDWDELIVMEGASECAIEARNPVIAGDTLAFLTWDMAQGSRLVAVNLTTGDCRIHALSPNWDVGGLCAYRDGALLLSAWNWESDASEVYAVEPQSGGLEKYCALPASSGAEARSLLYDTANDRLYYALGGSLCAMDGQNSDAARELAAMPFGGNRLLTPALTSDGRYLCGDDARVIALGPASGTGERARLTINAFDSPLIEEALPIFAEAHPDVEVALLEDYPDPISAMMTQSSSVDIYILDVDSQEYGALLSRGYLAELSGSAALTQLVSEMYPGIRDAVTRAGELVALPIRLDAYQMSVNRNALEKMGLDREDLPGTWLEFLRFLQEFPERAQDSGVTAFELYFGVEDLRSNLLEIILGEYLQDYASKGGAFDAEGLLTLLTEFEKVDFEALFEEGAAIDESAYENSLFALYGYATCEVVSYGYPVELLPLALREGESGSLNGSVTVAVVNPYSENRDIAVTFLEEVASRFTGAFLCDTCPDRNEPVRIEGFEEISEDIEEEIAAAQAELEKADEKDKKAWEDKIASRKEYQDEFLNTYSWLVSPDSIAQYREAAQNLRIQRYLGLGMNNDFLFVDETIQYLDGALSAEDFVQVIADAIEMSAKEGT